MWERIFRLPPIVENLRLCSYVRIRLAKKTLFRSVAFFGVGYSFVKEQLFDEFLHLPLLGGYVFLRKAALLGAATFF